MVYRELKHHNPGTLEFPEQLSFALIQLAPWPVSAFYWNVSGLDIMLHYAKNKSLHGILQL